MTAQEWRERIATATARMGAIGERDVTNSVGPPVKPSRRRRNIIGLAILATLTLAWSEAPRSPETEQRPSGCIVNAYGSKLCDDDAIAYCDLVDGGPDSRSYEACESVGWSWTQDAPE